MSGDMKDRKVTAVIAIWWYHRGETQRRVVNYFFLIESLTFVIFLRVEIDKRSLLGPCVHLRSS